MQILLDWGIVCLLHDATRIYIYYAFQLNEIMYLAAQVSKNILNNACLCDFHELQKQEVIFVSLVALYIVDKMHAIFFFCLLFWTVPLEIGFSWLTNSR